MLQHNLFFQLLTKQQKLLTCFTNTDSDSNITQWKDLENYHNSLLSLKPSLNLELLENQFNNSTLENSNDPVKISSSKYDIEEMRNIEMPHKNKSLSLFHINVCSLNKSFDDLQHLFSCTKTKFDIAISETRITKQLSLQGSN